MNLYILVEGRRTEAKVYPAWIKHISPHLTRIDSPSKANNNNYFLISGNGYPSMLNHIENSIDDLNKYLNFDYFVICLDTDNNSSDTMENYVYDKLSNYKINYNTNIKIITQNKCIETWFLGNRKIFPRQPFKSNFTTFANHYNVSINDPEHMECPNDYENISKYHHDYLKEMLLERNVYYTKSNPGPVTQKYYLNELIKRMSLNHMSSFGNFYNFFSSL